MQTPSRPSSLLFKLAAGLSFLLVIGCAVWAVVLLPDRVDTLSTDADEPAHADNPPVVESILKALSSRDLLVFDPKKMQVVVPQKDIYLRFKALGT